MSLQWLHCESVSTGSESWGDWHRFGVHPLLWAAGSGLLYVHAKDWREKDGWHQQHGRGFWNRLQEVLCPSVMPALLSVSEKDSKWSIISDWEVVFFFFSQTVVLSSSFWLALSDKSVWENVCSLFVSVTVFNLSVLCFVFIFYFNVQNKLVSAGHILYKKHKMRIVVHIKVQLVLVCLLLNF